MMDIKNTETVAIENNFYNGQLWNQTLTNRKTGEQFLIGLIPNQENEDGEWHFDELRDLITEHISQYLPVDIKADKRFGLCKLNYQGYQMECEFTFEPWSDGPNDGWYVCDAWVLSANVLN